MRAFLFPGQGSQAVGMGAALAEASRAARDTFGEVDEALGQNLFRLMREGLRTSSSSPKMRSPRSWRIRLAFSAR